MDTTIQFADGLKPTKSNASHSESIGLGGVYPMRSRSSLHDRRNSIDRFSEKALPVDEDSGLHAEGDYKRRQVKHTLPAACRDDLTPASGLQHKAAFASGLPEYRGHLW
jgi:hypothetical protein